MIRKHLLYLSAAGLSLAGGLLPAAANKPNPFATPAATTAPAQRLVRPVSLPRPAATHEPMVIPAGTLIRVRLNETVSTKFNRPGDHFGATLVSPLVLNGQTVAGKGTQVSGIVRDARPSGRLKGRAQMVLALNGLEAGGHHVGITTSSPAYQSDGHKKRNWAWLGGGTGTGALIGGLAGGPAGAGIGAGAGAAAGLTGALITGKRQVRVPAETLVTFKLERPAMIQP